MDDKIECLSQKIKKTLQNIVYAYTIFKSTISEISDADMEDIKKNQKKYK